MPESSVAPATAWLGFVLISVAAWGTYGVLLHAGQGAMGDPVNGRYKAYLWVGIAYFIVAVLAPAVLLLVKGSDWSMPAAGIGWSLLAGTAGAIGAFGVLLAFGARGAPAVVMSLVFAGAPIVNAGIAIALHPPAGGWGALDKRFLLGIVLAAAGACLVTLYRPAPAPKHPAAPPATVSATIPDDAASPPADPRS